MLYLIGEVRPWAVAGAAPDDLVGVGDIDIVLGVSIREHPAFINKVIPALRPPHLHRITPRFMVGGQLHQAEIGPVVAVYIRAADFHDTSPSTDNPDCWASYAGIANPDRSEG